MTLSRDNQVKNAVVALAALTTFAAGVEATNESAAVNTKGFHAALFALQGSRILASADDFDYTFEESDDGSTNWTEVGDDNCLPYRKNPDKTMVIEVVPYTQTVGVFSTKQYVRVKIHGTADTTEFIVTPVVVMEADDSEFTGYDPAVVPGDGLP